MEVAMQIERDAIPPDPRKLQKKELPKFDLSGLESRLKAQFGYTKSKDNSSGVPRNKKNILTPDFITKIAVPVFFFTLISTWVLGMHVVMPILMEEEDPSCLTFHRWMMCMLFMEMLANWLCLRYVDSSYFRYLQVKWKARSGYKGSAHRGHSSAIDLGDRDLGFASLTTQNGSTGNEHDETNLLLDGMEKLGGQLANNGDVPSSFPDLDQASSRPPWKPAFRPNTSQTMYPYWSWSPCYICEVMRPPRCHHCPLCQVCVLKRDHHCFFAGTCVGWKNQRYFITFSFWALTACCYATFYSYHFLVNQLLPAMAWYDLFFPVAVVRWMAGYLPGLHALCMVVATLLIYFVSLTTYFLFEHCMLIWNGKTSFEIASLKKNLELRDTRSLAARIRSVMGRWWLLNLLLPLHWAFDAVEDPEDWPSIKVHRH